MKDISLNLDELINLRHELHMHPEVSNEEKQTAKRITDFLKTTEPDDLINDIGQYGIAAIYKGKKEGRTVMIRCELDALPIEEVNDMEYRSVNEGIGHKCGHDGHMTILCGLATLLAKNRPSSGRVILLFQPAEETGEGARRIIKDEKFKALEPDFIYALHNLPGFEKNEIIIKDNIFASASRGLIVKLKGAPSHASHPEDGRNPALAASKITQHLFEIPQMHTLFHKASLITPIYIRVGSPSFGTSPGEGELMATLRTHEDEDMQSIADKAQEIILKIADVHDLEAEISWTEEFEAVKNNKNCMGFIKKVAEDRDIKTRVVDHPFPWSEDFGLFTSHYNGALFGLGSGMDQPQLHNNDFDFPDDIIETGVVMFKEIIDQILEN
jgi:amidohydrolase